MSIVKDSFQQRTPLLAYGRDPWLMNRAVINDSHVTAGHYVWSRIVEEYWERFVKAQ